MQYIDWWAGKPLGITSIYHGIYRLGQGLCISKSLYSCAVVGVFVENDTAQLCCMYHPGRFIDQWYGKVCLNGDCLDVARWWGIQNRQIREMRSLRKVVLNVQNVNTARASCIRRAGDSRKSKYTEKSACITESDVQTDTYLHDYS